MQKTLVWLTHSFRKDSRLTTNLSGPCTFVYYSPFYFAGSREKEILRNCSQENLDAFYQSLDYMAMDLGTVNMDFHIFKKSNPIEHINELIDKYGFTKVVIDLPLFGMWKSTDPMDIKVPFELVDSDLIDDESPRMTAKSRWMSHTRKIHDIKWHKWNSTIENFKIDESVKSYPKFKNNPLVNPHLVSVRAQGIAPTYGETRDKHSGQTRLSTSFQNGTLDPHNTFFSIAKDFYNSGADFEINDGPHATMLRQFAFREISIIQARRTSLTMEDSTIDWVKAVITEKSYINLIEKVNEESTLTFDNIRNANTGDELVDQILSESYKVGVMPNRARMFYAGWLFYNAPSGIQALDWLIDTFDLLLIDGQCPTNYMQSCSTMNLQYGRVMLLNRNRVQDLLSY